MSPSTLAPPFARPRTAGLDLAQQLDAPPPRVPGLACVGWDPWRRAAEPGCSAKWAGWVATDARLAGVASLDEAVKGWRAGGGYSVVAALTALGSRRGGDDADATLAVVVLLGPGIARLAMTLRDVCELGDVQTAVWEEVKLAEPQVGALAARHLLLRTRQRLTRPGAGMISRTDALSLDQLLDGSAATGRRLSSGAGEGSDPDVVIAAPEVDNQAVDLVDLLSWARGAGVIGSDEVDLMVELVAAANRGMTVQEAQRLVGKRHGVGMRTIRRRRDAAVARLRGAAVDYLAAIA